MKKGERRYHKCGINLHCMVCQLCKYDTSDVRSWSNILSLGT